MPRVTYEVKLVREDEECPAGVIQGKIITRGERAGQKICIKTLVDGVEDTNMTKKTVKKVQKLTAMTNGETKTRRRRGRKAQWSRRKSKSKSKAKNTGEGGGAGGYGSKGASAGGRPRSASRSRSPPRHRTRNNNNNNNSNSSANSLTKLFAQAGLGNGGNNGGAGGGGALVEGGLEQATSLPAATLAAALQAYSQGDAAPPGAIVCEGPAAAVRFALRQFAARQFALVERSLHGRLRQQSHHKTGAERFRVSRGTPHLPMQNDEKTRLRTCSVSKLPVILLSDLDACSTSSAASSGIPNVALAC